MVQSALARSRQGIAYILGNHFVLAPYLEIILFPDCIAESTALCTCYLTEMIACGQTNMSAPYICPLRIVHGCVVKVRASVLNVRASDQGNGPAYRDCYKKLLGMQVEVEGRGGSSRAGRCVLTKLKGN